MKRLYIGGLSHTVTEKDLKDRFGKFGQVEDVELRTRRDDGGVPYKTFGYINIDISEADLKKCLTVLNRSKWKGGTLQIETAKESFLHKLDQERQAAAERQLQPPSADDPRQKLLDSLSNAGVNNFTMKAAVPGTEIPGHKDWVVSKFGRVLPVLQLKCQKGCKARTLKYDPSKYSHNIRRLDRDATEQTTPVAELTWQVHGGDDDISKKRRGEFPPYKPSRPKKSRTDVVNVQNAQSRTSRMETVSHSHAHPLTNGFKPAASQQAAQRTHFTDSDSDEEIRMLAATPSHGALLQEVEEDNLEVVGFDYLIKSGYKGDKDEEDYDSADTDELFASRKPPSAPQPQGKLSPPSNGSNAAGKNRAKRKNKAGGEGDAVEHIDTKTLCSTRLQEDSTKQKQTEKTSVRPVVQCTSSESDDDDDDQEELDSEESDYDDDDDQEELDSEESDYDAMFSNVTHLEISFEDLQKLAEEAQRSENTAATPSERPAPKKGITPEEILSALMGEDSSDDDERAKKKTKKKKGLTSTPLPAFKGTKMLNEEMERGERAEEDEEEESKRQKVDAEPPQLNHVTEKTKVGENCQEVAQKRTSESSEDEEEMKDDVVKNMRVPEVFKTVGSKIPVNQETVERGSSSSSEDDEEEEEEDEQQMKVTRTVSTLNWEAQSSSSSCSSSEKDEKEQKRISAADALKAAARTALDSESSSSEEEEEEEEQPPTRVVLGAKEEEERQREANLRRLAAVQQKQKEAEEHKRLIQGALAKLDAPAAASGKHIVFNSDDDDDDDDAVDSGTDKRQTLSEAPTSKKTLLEDSQSEDESASDEAAANETKAVRERVRPKPPGHQLFGGSEDEEGNDEEEDSSRFDIRPQFEGPAGQKLMELQSRFGTDERFRIDSRFLEEDEDKEEDSDVKRSQTEEDEALDDERKKNLSILQSVLGSSQQTCSSKTAVKAKKFRDVAALHYDPSKEEHAAFETKTDESKKESKSARKKKREEALKLPEVSKEIYYDVSGDLKAVFGQTKDDIPEGEEKMNWDQVEEKEEEEEEVEEEENEEEEEEPAASSSLLSAEPEKDDSSGFKFSFFGEDTETTSGETAEYKVESIQTPKVSWQQDPRFHDSSSDEEEDGSEEEEEEDEDAEQSSTTVKTTKDEALVQTDSFFFHPDDNRLAEGPRLFCRVLELEEQKEEWEERRTALRKEYRKKHKDARRKLTSSLKS